MKRLIISLAISLSAPAAFAACIGSGSLQTCTDNTGNTYNIQRFGNTTSMQGYNPSTGSNWSQNTTKLGNTTFHNGISADGNSWNGTSQRIGSTTFHSGTDSRGNYYQKTCNQYGCY